MWITPEAEKHIAYCARVSSANQDNAEYSKLIAYLIRHKHWSPFEMASMCVEITTSKAVAAQIIRHRSFSFQEFSARYAEVQSFEQIETRLQDSKNRQNSIPAEDPALSTWFENAQLLLQGSAEALYNEALTRGVAKECARYLLPQSATAKLYMAGTMRSFMHYVDVRTGPETQKEHRQIAEQIKNIMCAHMPIVAEALQWLK